MSCIAAPGLVAQSLPDDSRSAPAPAVAPSAAPGAAPAFTVDLASVNPGADVERSACVTVAIRANLAYECGDLRLTYALQANLFRNQTRAPVLLYNSQHARPTPIVRVAVTPTAAWPGSPESVTATLHVQQSPGATPVIRATRTWTGSALAAFATGQPVQLALSFDATAPTELPTNLYPISVEITMTFGGATVPPVPPVSGELAIVNRKGSEFGTGWWVAGYERLQRLPDGNLFWVGGDGSTRRYVLQSTAGPRKVYAARTLTGRDSLTEFVDSATFRRHLTRGAYVHFTASGRHDQTVSSVGAVTIFSSERCTFLTGIAVASSSAPNTTAQRWRFWYDSWDNDFECVLYNPANPSAPYERIDGTTTGNHPNTRQVWRFLYPDSGSFLRQAGPGVFVNSERYAYTEKNGRIRTYRDTFGAETQIDWDSSGTIKSAWMLNPGGDGSPFLRFRAGEAVAVVEPVLASLATTQLTGPRGDETTLHLGAFGQPTRIVNPLGHTTQITYSPTFPLLAIEVVAPNGYRTTATYDALGRLTLMGADGVNGPEFLDIYTQYNYDPSPQRADLLVSSISPTSVVTRYGYDTIPGANYPLLAYEQTGDSATRRTKYRYCAADPCRGLVRAVESPVNGPNGRTSTDTLEYDTYGNLSATQSAGGKRVEYVNDNTYGRVASIRTRIATTPTVRWVTEQIAYDLLDRVVSRFTEASGEGTTLYQYFTTVTDYVGASAMPRRVSRYANQTLDSIGILRDSFTYDAIGRVREKFAQGASRTVPERLTYDNAGNVTRRITPTGDTITMAYDLLNRLRWRTATRVKYDSVRVGSAYYAPSDASRSPAFPRLALGVEPLYVDRDSAAFTYDDNGTTTGQLRTANNRASRIARTYFPNGWVQTDTQRLSAVLDTTDFSQHVYGIGYLYDDAGRRIGVEHPQQLAVGLPRSLERTYYDFVTGLPGAVGDLTNGGLIEFTFNAAEQMTRMRWPGGIVRGMGYTVDGELERDTVLNSAVAPAAPLPSTNGVARNATLTYDARGKLLSMANPVGLRDTLRTDYSPLGHARVTQYVANETFARSASAFRSTDTLHSDALGHALTGRQLSSAAANDGFFWLMRAGSSQFSWQKTGMSYVKDGSGRLLSSSLGFGVSTNEYDAAGRVHLKRSPGVANTAMVLPAAERMQYYDGLGQLVAVDARRAPEPGANNFASPEYMLLFDQYRYDALGRRVLTRSQRACPMNQASADWKECLISSVQRTVWDGSRELWEIRMPDTPGTRENDTAPLPEMLAFGYSSTFPNDPNNIDASLDLNAKSGRVGYIYGAGGGVDRPLAVHRLGYADRPFTFAYERLPFKQWAPFTLYPQWDVRGTPALGTTTDGGMYPCEGTGAAKRCTYALAWSGLWARNGVSDVAGVKTAWVGSLLEDKLDGTGLLYRRNRYLDGGSGQFTQPDPIGLGGGLSSYGFANGDPVNYSDPFGLCPDETPLCQFIRGVGQRVAPLSRAADATAEKIAEFSGLADVGRAGGQIRDGHYAAAAGSLVFAFAGEIPGGRIALNLRRTLRGAQGADVAVTKVGRFVKATWEVAGEGSGQSRTIWTKFIDEEGRTIKAYHDSYDRAGTFQHRKFKFPDQHKAP